MKIPTHPVAAVFLNVLVASTPARAESLAAIVVARHGDISDEATSGLALKLGVELREQRVINLRIAGSTGLPPETDPFWRTCFGDDDCLVDLSATLGDSDTLLVLFDLVNQVPETRLALVDARLRRIFRKSKPLATPEVGAIVELVRRVVDARQRATSVEAAPRFVPADLSAMPPPPQPARPFGEQAFAECADLTAPIPAQDTLGPNDEPPAFDRQWALIARPVLLPGVSSRYQAELARMFEEAMLREYPLPRFRYVKACEGEEPLEVPTLDALRAIPPKRVRYIFSPRLSAWEEVPARRDTVDAHGNSVSYNGFELAASAAIEVFEVENGVLREVAVLEANAPSFFDFLSFVAEDEVLGGPNANSESAAFTYDAARLLQRVAKKLALETRKVDRFRLAANVIRWDGSDAAVALGEEEGVALDDTYVLVPVGGTIDDYQGFGRIREVGRGGANGRRSPSSFQLLGGDESPELRLVEWPHLGFLFALSGGVSPTSHLQFILPSGEIVLTKDKFTLTGFSGAMNLDVAWLLPLGLVSELYVRARLTLSLNLPALPGLGFESGLEKRWYFGRLGLLLGLGYSRVAYAIALTPAMPDPTVDTPVASASTNGIAGQFGASLLLTPDFAINLVGGYRQMFGKMDTFEVDDVPVQLEATQGGPFIVDASGPFLSLGLEYRL